MHDNVGKHARDAKHGKVGKRARVAKRGKEFGQACPIGTGEETAYLLTRYTLLPSTLSCRRG